MLPDELARVFYQASVDAGKPRRISRSSNQFRFFEKISRLLKPTDDPYTYFRVLLEKGMEWPFQMSTKEAYASYEIWKVDKLSAGLKPQLKRTEDKVFSAVYEWEERYRGSGKDFLEFVHENRFLVSPYWVALYDDEWERIRSEMPYDFFHKVKQARIWLRKKGRLHKALKEVVDERRTPEG